MRLSDRERWDAVVIGAGPAGAVAARLLAIGGARVLLVDQKAIPRRKVCGACWSASGLKLLRAIGAGERIQALGGVRLEQFHMRSPAGDLRVPMPEGLAVSRAAMDAALVQHAVAAGVAMSWRIGDHGFEMTLAATVPDLIRKHLRGWLSAWLHEHDHSIESVGSWAIHPGGPRILHACTEAIGLTRDQVAVSEEVLAEFGNMSSPTALFIVDRLRERHAPRPCVSLAFGPGLAAEAALFC